LAGGKEKKEVQVSTAAMSSWPLLLLLFWLLLFARLICCRFPLLMLPFRTRPARPVRTPELQDSHTNRCTVGVGKWNFFENLDFPIKSYSILGNPQLPIFTPDRTCIFLYDINGLLSHFG